jgi:hypothetical protein
MLKAFTLAEAHKASVFEVEFGIKIASGTYNDADLKLAIYDVTNSAYIEVTPAEIYLNSSLTARIKGTFQTSSDGTSYEVRLLVNNTATNTYTLLVDGFSGSSWYVGPQRGGVSGAVITDPVAYTPTITGVGTPTDVNVFWSRRGKYLEVYGSFTTGTVDATTVSLSLPSGLVSNTYATMIVGEFIKSTATINTVKNGKVLSVAYTSVVTFAIDEYTLNYNAINGQAGNVIFSNSQIVRFNFSVPILGWSSNTVMSEDAGNREIAAWGAAGVLDLSTTSVNYPLTAAPVNDTANMWTSGSLIIPETGWYDLIITQQLPADGSAPRRVLLNYFTGTNIQANWYSTTTTTLQNTSFSVTRPFTKGNVLTFKSSIQSGTLAGTSLFYSIAKRSSPQTIAASEKVYEQYNSNIMQTIGTSASQLIHEDKVYSTHGAYNPSTGIFTAPRSGLLSISLNYITGTVTLSNIQRIHVWMKKVIGGDYVLYSRVNGTGGSNQYSGNVSNTIYVTKGEQLDVYASSSVATNLDGTSVVNYVTFSME